MSNEITGEEGNRDTVKSIVIKYLAEEHLDGLYSECHGCACKFDNLMPCEHDKSTCMPGVIVDEQENGDFVIGERK